MTTHPAPEQLAAFFAGDAEEAVGAHVRACARCTADVSAIEQTVADLKAMPQPEPRGADVAAWRGAIEAKRTRRAPLAWRWATAASGVAAVIIGFVAFSGGSALNTRGADDTVAVMEDAASAPAAWTPASVDALIGRSRASGPELSADAQASGTFSHPSSGGTRRGASLQTAEACDREIWAGKDHPAPIVHEGTWADRPVWVLVYRLGERRTTEAWVVAKAACETVYFAQAPL